MTPRELGAWLLKRWPLVGICVVLIALVGGLAFGTFYSDGGVRILAQDPVPTPTLSFVMNTPTDAELDEMKAIYLKTRTATAQQASADSARQSAVATVEVKANAQQASADPVAEEMLRVFMLSAPTPRSTAEAQYWASDRERTIYLEEADRLIHLPESIEEAHKMYGGMPPVRYWCGAPDLPSPVCPTSPAYELDLMNGDSVTIDSAGYVFAYKNVDIPSFLSEFTFIPWPGDGPRSKEEIIATATAFAIQEANKLLKETD